VFGITGDLPRVMTFRSLQRLVQRRLLDCPIVGIAVDDWTAEQLVQRARSFIVGTGERLDPEVFDRFAARLSYVQGDFGDAATYDRVGAAIKAATHPVFYLEIPSFPLRDGEGLADAGLTESGSVVVESRSVTCLPRTARDAGHSNDQVSRGNHLWCPSREPLSSQPGSARAQTTMKSHVITSRSVGRPSDDSPVGKQQHDDQRDPREEDGQQTPQQRAVALAPGDGHCEGQENDPKKRDDQPPDESHGIPPFSSRWRIARIFSK
jgi:Glucose-6-phosphate dehydrogenase, NAD binding domain